MSGAPFSFPPGGDSDRGEVTALLRALLPFASDALRPRIERALRLIEQAQALGTERGNA